ncbi:MAG: DEAD/DEAH box helicase [Erysipelotrichaceae bacterium]|nr:DEAD/DEAH box helicase [Erysipelotrichaceae bacterium]
MECLRCGNKDPGYFYKGHKGYYCRKCIRYSRVLLEEEPETFSYEISEEAGEYRFDYPLTPIQLEASERCLKDLREGDILLHAVCGAGKTEIAIASISHYLDEGRKVAYAIPRKEVVIELEKRFRKIFHKADVISVYGGHHEKISGDLIVCTTHQLYRYYRSFDLLVLDEVDAFPLKGDETLMNICLNSCKGRILFSTATIDEWLKKTLHKRQYKKVEVYTRPSGNPLSIPAVYYVNQYLGFIGLYMIMRRMANQCLIFVPSKKLCRIMYRIFAHFFTCTYVYADLEERNKNVLFFRNGEKKFCFSTTVLERGITIKGISVIIYDYGNIFDQSNLIQMLGRVNRGIGDNEGKTFLFTDRYSRKLAQTMKYLKEANSYL